jgi:hypothetical protein
VLEGRRGLTIEASCFGIKAQHLSLGVAAPMDHSVSLRRFLTPAHRPAGT